MQFPYAQQHTQLPLFEAFLAQPLAPILSDAVESPWTAPAEPEVFSELSLRGAAGNCLSLLAPILRELSEEQDARWLTLIAPPSSLTQVWLRDAGLNRERILLLQPRGTQSAQQLTCEALRLGRSHTVVSWLNPLNASAKQQLINAARAGDAQSLNIRLG
ncbi:cell division inhibitor [Pseudomonas fluorescens]|uniref:Cell division inhibitor n=1 Tax=Pseudomonas fluorescens TaxID=294 RepID=A0A379IGJ9_PSEFL|nr:SOS-induced cell division inhibitor SulA [Pseudomonas fluorescens]AIG02120.1 CDP-glycerol--UDP-pyrophosphoryl-N-acetylglucosaminyl-N-acetylmannosamine glycerophosphotransferase [Pseudomonas fluorescens]SUD32575.1 cell division inhibitor [Pseudomonas fluorescens]